MCFVCPVSLVPNVASVSGLFILDCPFGFLWVSYPKSPTHCYHILLYLEHLTTSRSQVAILTCFFPRVIWSGRWTSKYQTFTPLVLWNMVGSLQAVMLLLWSNCLKLEIKEGTLQTGRLHEKWLGRWWKG